jgi:hypothetical protein
MRDKMNVLDVLGLQASMLIFFTGDPALIFIKPAEKNVNSK